MRTIAKLCALVACIAGTVLAVASCGNAQSPSSGVVATVPNTPETGAVSPTDVPSPAAATPPPPASPQQWVMPNLVGSNLQGAQDQIQALTGNPLFITFSHDATGRDRQQVLDSNWKVCSQNVAPGATIASSTRIDFGAVKLAEKCQ